MVSERNVFLQSFRGNNPERGQTRIRRAEEAMLILDRSSCLIREASTPAAPVPPSRAGESRSGEPSAHLAGVGLNDREKFREYNGTRRASRLSPEAGRY